MYKEIIEEYAVHNAYIRIHEPATAGQVSDAETALGRRFPDELKKLLLELNGDGYLFFSAQEIVDTTRLTIEGLKEYCPDIHKHIFFAGNGCGDYYCYKIFPDGRTDDSMVCIWEHETDETRPVAANIPDLIKGYYNNKF